MAAEKAKAILNNGNSCLVPFTNLDNFKKINSSLIQEILLPDEDGNYPDDVVIEAKDSVLSKAIDGFRKENESLEAENEKLKEQLEKLLAENKKLKEKPKAKTGK